MKQQSIQCERDHRGPEPDLTKVGVVKKPYPGVRLQQPQHRACSPRAETKVTLSHIRAVSEGWDGSSGNTPQSGQHPQAAAEAQDCESRLGLTSSCCSSDCPPVTAISCASFTACSEEYCGVSFHSACRAEKRPKLRHLRLSVAGSQPQPSCHGAVSECFTLLRQQSAFGG